MTDRLLTLKETEQLLNVSKSTLQRWDRSGKLCAVRTEGNHRRYKKSDIDSIIGTVETSADTANIVVATYARCSSADQKNHGDLDRQSARLFEYCTGHKYKVEHIIKDVGSGLNDKRKGFVKLCNLVVNRKINKVIVEHKDRLTRFQFNLIKFFFNSYGVEVELLDKKEYTQQEELVNDIMMLMASFSGKCYGQRAKENKAKRKQNVS
jgi:putative resolvase